MANRKTDATEGAQRSQDAAAGGGAAKKVSAQKRSSTPGADTAAQSASKSAAKGASKAVAKGAAKGVTADSGAGGKSAAKQPRAAGGAKQARSRGGQPDLQGDVRGFVSSRPQGWNHDDWLSFLEDLRGRGHNIEDRDAIGSLLERERLGQMLEKVPGIGAQRVRSISERYGNVWRLKETSADDLARDANIPRPLAERIIESVR